MYEQITAELKQKNVCLVAVSKTKPPEDIRAMYQKGQRDFGENKVQELTEKAELLPKDIRWHFIGHLQRNKVKYIAPFIHLIHSVDSFRLLREINKQARKQDRVIDVLLQFHIARESSKYGLSKEEAVDMLQHPDFATMDHIRIIGVMGMATFTDDLEQVRGEFASLHAIFSQLKEDFFEDAPHFREISMGMSGDYHTAIEQGSTMVRIGTLLFGARDYA